MSEAAKTLLLDLESGGVKVTAPQCDIGNNESLGSALASIDTIGHPIKGCIHGAMALQVCDSMHDI